MKLNQFEIVIDGEVKDENEQMHGIHVVLSGNPRACQIMLQKMDIL